MVDYIGIGVYTLQEAALYSGASSHKLSRWLYGTKETAPIIKSQFYDEHLVSFLDLIQAKAINHARKLGISMQKIREAINTVKKDYDMDFPLAYNKALVEFDNQLLFQNRDTQEIIQVTGKPKHQKMIPDIIKGFMQDLEFNVEGKAIKYTPFVSNGIKITLNPKVQFGQPLVGNTGYRADILYKAYLAEDSYKSVTDEFAVEIDDVKTAVLYMESLKVAA